MPSARKVGILQPSISHRTYRMPSARIVGNKKASISNRKSTISGDRSTHSAVELLNSDNKRTSEQKEENHENEKYRQRKQQRLESTNLNKFGASSQFDYEEQTVKRTGGNVSVDDDEDSLDGFLREAIREATNDKIRSSARYFRLKKDETERSTFESYFSQLQKFKEKYGHCNINSHTSVSKEYESLQKWCVGLRESYVQLRYGTKPAISLSKAAIGRLHNIGFTFEKKLSFGDCFRKLMEFKAKHGHCDVPDASKEYKILAKWCRVLRKSYENRNRGLESVISDRNILKLEHAGFKW